MPLAHTPKKTVSNANTQSPQNETGNGKESLSPKKQTHLTNVRRSIGEWECGVDPKPSTSTATSCPPCALSTIPLVLQKQKTKEASKSACRTSDELVSVPPSTEKEIAKNSDRIKEGRALLIKIKTYLGESRNLKSDLKMGITVSVEKLYQLLKEEAINTTPDTKKGSETKYKREETQEPGLIPEAEIKEQQKFKKLERLLEDQTKLLLQNKADMEALRKSLEQREDMEGLGEVQKGNLEKLVDEIKEIRLTTDNTSRKISSLHDAMPTYAEVLAKSNSTQITPKTRPQHSVIVSSNIEKDTSEEVLGKVREALGATTNGFQVTRAQKVRNQKVVISCATKEELQKVTEKIRAKNLAVEVAKNKDPLVIIKNLLAFNTDENIVASLRSQNGSILGDLAEEEFRAMVRYRKKARNPHENHVVLQVSPKVWQRLTETGRIHIDLQYVAVSDQSPLIQCTRCLGYGHGRKLCKEPADLCSYCTGPHLRRDCPSYLMGETPNCRNCRLAKNPEIGHNAFDSECPIRKRWDAISRSSVAYQC